MKDKYSDAVAVIMYTDGGPDHNCKHMSVRLGLLALFLELDLDTMVVMRTAPTQSWGNPVERVMSVLNLGLQGVALAREELGDDVYEKEFKKCNGMNDVRNVSHAYELIEDPKGGERETQSQPLPNQQDEELNMLLQEEEEHQHRLEEEEHQCPLHAYELGEHAHDLRIGAICRQEVEHHDAYHIDMTGWEDDEVDHGEHHEEQDVRAHVDALADGLEKPTKNPFIESYMKSIQAVRETIRGQWNECKWDNKYLNNEAPATSNEVDALHFQ
jgi:hypothetical protein